MGSNGCYHYSSIGHSERAQKIRYALSGLQILNHLNRRKLSDLDQEPSFESEYNALLNQTIRTVVIRNWPNIEFLHLVFLRLNTGSVRLSPQELRQALIPGKYTDWVDEAASQSEPLKKILNLSEPDYRMRDVELLARFMAFRFFLREYPGRMKRFLDNSFEKLNRRWATLGEDDGKVAEVEAAEAITSFEAAVEVLRSIFGDNEVARKPGSRPFNRALFDLLVFYAQDPHIRAQMEANPNAVRRAYERLFTDTTFVSAVDRDTAGLPNTAVRLGTWGQELQKALNTSFSIPTLSSDGSSEKIHFAGF